MDEWMKEAEWLADNYDQQAYNLACSFGNDENARRNRDKSRAALLAHLAARPLPQATLSEEEIEREWMRWNLESNDASIAFYRLSEAEKVRKAFCDGLQRSAVLAASRRVVVPRYRWRQDDDEVYGVMEGPVADGEWVKWSDVSAAPSPESLPVGDSADGVVASDTKKPGEPQ